MFDNIGKKIKTLAIVSFILGVIASIVFGIIFIVSGNKIVVEGLATEKEAGKELVSYGITFLVAGCIGSWLGSLATYGFGELIEQNQMQTALLQNIHHKLGNEGNGTPVYIPPQSQRKLPSAQSKPMISRQVRCENCAETYSTSDPRCPFCGHQK